MQCKCLKVTRAGAVLEVLQYEVLQFAMLQQHCRCTVVSVAMHRYY